MGNCVITISREYGSGGHAIGKRLAALLGIPFYDREVVELTAQKHGLDEARLNEMEDQSKLSLRFGFSSFTSFADTDERLFLLQSQTVVELVQQSCVIVGRCADFVLKEHPDRCSFFIYSGLKQRLTHIDRQKNIYHAENPAQMVTKMDRRRAAYYKYHTGQEWGAPSNYHLCVDSGVLGAKTADVFAAFLHLREQIRGGTQA